ncbi:MAG: ComEC/Rec2 family competence protein, partial [bacterium]|nr:ComEC/Rec2 family competence protein [bacterium]
APFYIFIFSFTGGVALASFREIGTSFLFFLVFLFFILLFHYVHSRAKIVFLVSLLLLGFAAGAFRFSVSALDDGSPLLEGMVGEKISFEGVIVEEPDARDQTAMLVMRTERVSSGGVEHELRKDVLLTVPQFPQFKYGDALSVSGVLKKPQAFANEGTGKLFDYPAYLSAKGVRYVMAFPSLELLGEGKGNPVRAALFALKGGFIKNIGELLHEPEGSLLAGLVVGAKQSLGKELLDKFRVVGLIHIVVLSGYNITIIAQSIMKLLGFLRRPALSASLASLSIVLFAVMVGGGATVVRASLMALLVILARRSGRIYDVTLALFLAGFLMVLHNPKILIFDPSFQLSFLATVGLIYFTPLIERHAGWLPERFLVREVAVATLATQLFVFPFLVYQMGTASLVALPVNLLTLVFVPATMLFGFIAGTLGFISAFLALPFAFAAEALLSYMLLVVSLFSKIPFAAIAVPSVPFLAVVIVYLLYLALIYKEKKKPALLWNA